MKTNAPSCKVTSIINQLFIGLMFMPRKFGEKVTLASKDVLYQIEKHGGLVSSGQRKYRSLNKETNT